MTAATKGVYTYDYPRPALCVDALVFTVSPDYQNLKVLVIERGEDPYKGCLALPGGHVDPDETLEEACVRELYEETGLLLQPQDLHDLKTYGDPARDPRGRVISTAYWSLYREQDLPPVMGGSDAADARLVLVRDLDLHGRNDPRSPTLADLAFDHRTIILDGLRALRAETRNGSVLFDQVMFEDFTLRDLRTAWATVYEDIPCEKRNFCAKVRKHPCVRPVPEAFRTGNHRPAQLYRHSRVCNMPHLLGHDPVFQARERRGQTPKAPPRLSLPTLKPLSPADLADLDREEQEWREAINAHWHPVPLDQKRL